MSNGVSVVVPNRDGAGLVGRCVAAALAAGAAEVIVVDDGSADASAAEAEAAGGRVVDSAGRGFSAAVNTGVSLATHELLLVLNSDCFLEREALLRLAETLARRPSLGACGAALLDEDGVATRSHGHLLTLALALRAAISWAPPPPPDAGEGVQDVTFLPLACVLVRRAAWRHLGGLDERYTFYFEDHDLCWRLRAAGWALAVRWDARAIHVGGGSSHRREPQRWFRQYHESRARYLRKRYPRSWPLYAAVWIPSALVHAAAWLGRPRPHRLAWARAYVASAFAGLGR